MFGLTALCAISGMFAQTFEQGGIAYSVTSATEPFTVRVTFKTIKYSGSVVIPEQINYDGKDYLVTSIGPNAFDDCYGLTSVFIPNSVTNIAYQAFYGCSGLSAISIPNSVTTIGDRAFYNCSGLSTLTIPAAVTSIGEQAFSSCTNLLSIDVHAENPNYSSLDGILYNKNITQLIQCPGAKLNVVIPNSVITIGFRAFFKCTGLISVTIPASVTSMGDEVFNSCSGLTSISVDTNNPNYASFDGVLYNKGLTTLIECPQAKTSINISGSTIAIGNRAFWSCTGLTSITLPATVSTIGTFAFFNCNGLSTVTIPGSVTSIGARAFANCKNLASIVVEPENPNYSSLDGVLFNKDITTLIQFPYTATTYKIPNSVVSIADWAFWICDNLKTIYIPRSVTSIGGYAFSDCTGLTSVTSYAITPPALGAGVFNQVFKTIPLKVPCTDAVNYQAASQWGDFTNIQGIATIPMPLPDDAGIISGDVLICQGQTAVNYVVPTINYAELYSWTLPDGTSGASNTNSIDVDYGASAISGNITVKGLNVCGFEGESSVLAITVNSVPVNTGNISGDAAVCQGQSDVTYTFNEIANATSYVWTLPDGATGTNSTNSINVNYGVSASSGIITAKGINSCGESNVSTLAITVNSKPATPIITLDDNVLESSAAFGNQWYNQSGVIEGAVNQAYTVIITGNYYVVVTLSGCSSDASNVINYISTGIGDTKINMNFKVYPNPVTNLLFIDADANNSDEIIYEIFSANGQIVVKGSFTQKATIQTDKLNRGVYIIRLQTLNGIIVQKIIKE